MTTIAYDGTTIAADGQRTWGDQIAGLSFRKLRREGDTIYGFTGLAPMFDVMVAWHRNGADPGKLPVGHDKDGWTLVVVDKSGLGKYTSTCPYIERFDPPVAFGAGQDYAVGAMWAGATAEHAVRLVAQNTNHTGGDIQAIGVVPILAQQRPEAAE